jgi:hypothetical protein
MEFAMTAIVGVATVLGALASVLALLVSARGRQIRAQRLRTLEEEEARYERLAPHMPVILSPEAVLALETLKLERKMTDEAMHRINQRRKLLARWESWDVAVGHKPERPTRLKHMTATLSLGKRSRTPVPDIPSWAFTLMATQDAQRYAREWGAHLHQLIEEGALRQARRDRRRLALAAITLAVALRVRRALGRARS